MKSIRVHAFGGPEVLKLEEVPDPKPGPTQVVVRAKAIGVNPVETYIRAGIYGPRPFPYTPGADAAGTVEAVGADVKQFKPGDRVYVSSAVNGTYCELILSEQSGVHPLPGKISFAQGAAIGVPAVTAYRGLFVRAAAKPGETVLIHGATGAVGLSAVQLGHAAGMTIIGTGGSEKGRKLLADQGAHYVLDHHSPDHFKQVMELTQGRGVEIILEMLANINLGNDLTILAKHGRVVVIGSRGPVQIDARNTMAREADIRGMTIMNATPEELKSIHAALGAALENQTLRPIIDTELPLAQAAQAHEEVMKGESHGKIVLIP